MVLGNSMLIPVLPAIKSALHTNQFRVGLLITAFSVPAGIVIPFAGMLSDQIGRLKVMVPALIIYGLGGLWAGASSIMFNEPYTMILIGRIIQGIGAGGTYQLAMALTGDIFKSEERVKALGFLEASNGLGKVISPLAGAAAGLLSWYAPFFIYGILAIPIGIALWFVVKEPEDSIKKQALKEYFQALKEVFKAKALPLAASFLSGMVVLFVLFGVLSYYSDVLEQTFHIKGFLKGVVIAGPVLVMAIVSFTLGILLQKTAKNLFHWIIAVGLAFVITGQMIFALVSSFWGMFAAMLVLGLGVGSVLPPVNALVTGSTQSQRRGLITCLYGTVRFFGVAIGPPTFGFIETMGKLPVLLASASLTLLVLILALIFIKENKILTQDQNKKDGAQ
jgi:ACDE family multidrug resistance protein